MSGITTFATRSARVLPAVLLAVAVWAIIPGGVWWAGAPAEYYSVHWAAWMWGSLVTVGIGVALLILTRGGLAAWPRNLWRRQLRSVRAPVFVAALSVLVASLALLACFVVFDGNPRSVDGFAQLFHARMFLEGRTWMPAPPEMASFGTLHMILGPERWLSQYPPGQPAVLAAGLALGAWWALNPLFVVLLMVSLHRVARWCTDESTARLALILAALSPLIVLVAGSEMSHLPAAALGTAAAAAATGTGGRRPHLAAIAAGLALGLMVAFRPIDAVAAAIPVGAIALLASSQRFRVLATLAGAGVVGTAPLLWFNHATTGHWLQLGYTLLWGPEVGLGFHPVPWGIPLTPARAVGLTGLDFHQINTYLFDLPFPILLVVAAGYVAGRRRLGPRDVVPAVGVLALVALLFFYWHRDVLYGPRLLYSIAPWLLLLTARAIVLLARAKREWRDGVTTGQAGAALLGVAFLVGLVTITPGHLVGYRDAAPVSTLHPERDAARAGIHNAVVLVPDGWGSRLIARMWALGVPMRRSTRLYTGIDACTLHRALEDAARDPGRRAGLERTLDSLAALRRPGARLRLTDDPHLRLPEGGQLPQACVDELRLDQGGFLNYPRFLWLNEPGLDGDIVWARDQAGWNDALMRRYPGRRFYRYAPAASGGAPRFTELPANLSRAAPR